jgi:hypothetical protein
LTGFDFAVIDLSSPSDFYLLSDGEVNSQNDYHAQKLGWFKSDFERQIDESIRSFITYSLPGGNRFSCLKNQITLMPSFLSTSGFLQENTIKLSSHIAPGSFINDEDLWINLSEVGAIPDHTITDYYYLDQGWMIISENSYPNFIGITAQGFVVPAFENELLCPNMGPIMTNNGLYPNGTCFQYTDTLIYTQYTCGGNYTGNPVSGNLRIFMMYNLFNISVNGTTVLSPTYGVCLSFYAPMCPSYTPAYSSANFNGGSYTWCTNITFQAYSYPSLLWSTFSFDPINGFQTTYNISSSETAKSIVINSHNGVLDLSLEFRNFSVNFIDTNVKPIINFVTVKNDGSLIINAQSTTVAGSCYASTVPAGILIAQPIDLTLTPRDNHFRFTIAQYKGNIEVIVACYKLSAKMNITVDYDIRPNPVPLPPPIEGGSGGEFVEEGDSIFDKLQKALLGPWSVGSSLDKFVSVIWWVVAIIACIIGLLLIYYIFRFLWVVICKLKFVGKLILKPLSWLKSKKKTKVLAPSEMKKLL